MTTTMEFADLLKTIDPGLPCGDDLEYDAGFLQLQQDMVGKSEQQFGDTIIPAQPPDWHAVEKQALALLERTRDLRVIACLARAWTETRGLPGYAEGLALAAGTLERYWDGVHPRLDADGEPDPLPRVNALASLGDPQGCARSARSACLIDDVHGRLSLRDAELLLDGARTEADYPGGRARLVENLRRAWLQADPAALAVAQAAASLRGMQDLAASRLGPAWCPDYAPVLRTLDAVRRTWRDLEPGGQPLSPDDAASAAPAAGAPASEAAPAGKGAAPGEAVRWQQAQIRSREEAAAMLSKVCAYFDAHEPSHPAPYLIRRAQQLIPMDFHDILRNLAPQGLEQFEAWLPRPAGERPGA